MQDVGERDIDEFLNKNKAWENLPQTIEDYKKSKK